MKKSFALALIVYSVGALAKPASDFNHERSIQEIEAQEPITHSNLTKDIEYCQLVEAQRKIGIEKMYNISSHKNLLKKFNEVIEDKKYELIAVYADLLTNSAIISETNLKKAEALAKNFPDKKQLLTPGTNKFNTRKLFDAIEAKYHTLIHEALLRAGVKSHQMKLEEGAPALYLDGNEIHSGIAYDSKTKQFYISVGNHFSSAWDAFAEQDKTGIQATPDDEMKMIVSGSFAKVYSDSDIRITSSTFLDDVSSQQLIGDALNESGFKCDAAGSVPGSQSREGEAGAAK